VKAALIPSLGEAETSIHIDPEIIESEAKETKLGKIGPGGGPPSKYKEAGKIVRYQGSNFRRGKKKGSTKTTEGRGLQTIGDCNAGTLLRAIGEEGISRLGKIREI